MTSWFRISSEGPGIIASVFLLIAVCSVPGIARAQGSSPSTVRLEVHGDSLVSRTFTAADLAQLPRVSVRAIAHGNSVTYSGVTLASVLRRAGVPIDSVRGKRAASYVLASATDGYRVVFSLAELAPDLTGRVVLLADERDGKPLAGDEGPLRLVLPDDTRPTRWIRQIATLTVRQATP